METQVKYVPKQCTDHEVEVGKKKQKVAASFTGHMIMRAPSFDERYEVLEQQGLEIEGNEVVQAKGSNPFAQLRKLVKNSEKYYVEVHLKRIKDGKEFKSFADLSADAGCDMILIDVARAVRTAFTVGED